MISKETIDYGLYKIKNAKGAYRRLFIRIERATFTGFVALGCPRILLGRSLFDLPPM